VEDVDSRMNRRGPVDELPAYLKGVSALCGCLLPRFVLPSYQMNSNNSAHLVISNVMMIRVICAEIFAACSAAQACCAADTVYKSSTKT
jgi:hypothetical protein